MRIGYAKMGRSMTMDPGKYGMQGDAEAPQLLIRLARRNPGVTFVITGKHGKIPDEVREALPKNVEVLWPDEVPRARWNAKGDGYFCSFCKAQLVSADVNSLCGCERGGMVRAYEQYLIDTMRNLDGMIVHLGQHGTSNMPIPMTKRTWNDPPIGGFTNPQVWARNYAGSLIEGLNAMGDRTDGKAPVSWICTDPRNYLKARDVKWPTGLDQILSQYRFSRGQLHDRFGDPRPPSELGFRAKVERNGELWRADHHYWHADLELMILPDDWETWRGREFEDRFDIGVASTGAWADRAEWRRSWMIREYVLKFFPHADVYGKFDEKSMVDFGDHEVKTNKPEQFPLLLQAWKTTVALPPASRGADHVKWTTAKPYQCWAARSACFLIGEQDKQGWMLPSRHRTAEATEVAQGLWSVRDDWTDEDLYLARWLRILKPEELHKAVTAVSTSKETWEWITEAQLNLLRRRRDDHFLERNIERQLGITGGAS